MGSAARRREAAVEPWLATVVALLQRDVRGAVRLVLGRDLHTTSSQITIIAKCAKASLTIAKRAYLQVVVDEAHVTRLDLTDNLSVAGIGLSFLFRNVGELLFQAFDFKVLSAAPTLMLLKCGMEEN